MVNLPIEKRLAEHLAAIAQAEQRSINEVLDDLLERYQVTCPANRWAQIMARMVDDDVNAAWD